MSSCKHYFRLLIVAAALLGLVVCGAEGPSTPSNESLELSDPSPSVTGLATSSNMRGRGQTKVTICHIPPGNPANAHEITVGLPAVRAHVAHGDPDPFETPGGECPPVAPPPLTCDQQLDCEPLTLQQCALSDKCEVVLNEFCLCKQPPASKRRR